MNKLPVIAIFDFGRTNKKFFLFDEQYKIVYEKTVQLTDTVDEDGDSCEDIKGLRQNIFDSLKEASANENFCIKAINISAYGASFVYIDESGKSLTPLYSYLKTYPTLLFRQFYDTYGGEINFSHHTASPVLGSLNSGMQLYRIKYEQPLIFSSIKYALHLPQYISYLLTGVAVSDITSIGCHTNLWNFEKSEYHHWVNEEHVIEKLAPIVEADKINTTTLEDNSYAVGIGLHDSSAALIPYLTNFHEPFILISTGTWCISLNPFNNTPLTTHELGNDCLCFLSFKGHPVKASRLFAGYEHEVQVKRIAQHFGSNTSNYKTILFDLAIVEKLQLEPNHSYEFDNLQSSVFAQRNLQDFSTEVEAYHQLMLDIVQQQSISTRFIVEGDLTKRIFVDGGFSNNNLYMNLLAINFPEMKVFAASMAQATAVGAALAIHDSWNSRAIPNDIIELKYFASMSNQITGKII